MDIKEYFADIRKYREQLLSQYPDGEVTLTSLANRAKGTTAGAVVLATIEIAARCLAEQTHRLATKEEIAKYRADERVLREEYRRRELASKQPLQVVISSADIAAAHDQPINLTGTGIIKSK